MCGGLLLLLISLPLALSLSFAAGVLGVGEHSDSGALTLLLQQPGTSGLQARNGAGAWVDVPPLPGTLVVNIGELLQIATGAAPTPRPAPPPRLETRLRLHGGAGVSCALSLLCR